MVRQKKETSGIACIANEFLSDSQIDGGGMASLLFSPTSGDKITNWSAWQELHKRWYVKFIKHQAFQARHTIFSIETGRWL